MCNCCVSYEENKKEVKLKKTSKKKNVEELRFNNNR